MADLAAPPTLTGTIDQRFLIEPLGGPQEVQSYLDRFPEEVYNKSLDSHLVKFMYSMMGPAGVGHLRRNYLSARLLFEANGIELFDLDRFYGNPFQFGRISDEMYTADIQGLLPQEEWEKIRAKDAKYRNRIIDFMAGARAGNTPLGMRLVARSGLGHEAEVIENYKALFDRNTDDPLGLPYYGKTRLLNEMIILPRQEAPKIESQTLMLLGSPTGGSFTLSIDGNATPVIAWDATARDVERALSKLVSVNDIIVTGGPFPDQQMTIKFIGALAGRLTQITATDALTGGVDPQVLITNVITQDAADSTTSITPRDQKHLQDALDRIRPLTVIPTFAEAAGNKGRINWLAASASSEFDEMVRYVTGAGVIKWPPRDSYRWIEQGVEHQALRSFNDLKYHYVNFHKVVQVDSYDDLHSTSADYHSADWHTNKSRFVSNHIGTYEPHHSALFQFLRLAGASEVMTADRATADYAEPLHIDRVVETPSGPLGLINSMYPADYQALPGAPSIRYATDQFWSSREKTTGAEYLEIDLGDVRAINNLQFELSRKPIQISIDYDTLALGGERIWAPVTINSSISSQLVSYASATEQNPWKLYNFYFTNSLGEMIYARYLRIKFARVTSTTFLTTGTTKYPWSVDVRNLRIGRSVANQ